jgi:hypothetical protein
LAATGSLGGFLFAGCTTLVNLPGGHVDVSESGVLVEFRGASVSVEEGRVIVEMAGLAVNPSVEGEEGA